MIRKTLPSNLSRSLNGMFIRLSFLPNAHGRVIHRPRGQFQRTFVVGGLTFFSASDNDRYHDYDRYHLGSNILSHRTHVVRARNQNRFYSSSSVHLTSASASASASASTKGVYEKITFIGAGKMAQALIQPLIDANLQPAENITLYDVSQSTMQSISQQYDNKIQTSQSIPEAVQDADLIVMAVKPQNLTKVYQEMQDSNTNIREDCTLLSVIAGKPIQSYLDGTPIQKIARSMPNTPAQIGQGVTVWTATSNISPEERTRIKQILCSFGKAIFVEDESYIDMSTSISGSGPAYVFLLMEAMIDAGVHMGFSREMATTLVHHTLLGSTLYAMESKEHPAILRNSVTSPAGTTASAIYELENGKFRTVIKDAIWACYRRSLEMGGADSNVGPGRMSVPKDLLQQLQSLQTLQSYSRHPVEVPGGEMIETENGNNGGSNGEYDEHGSSANSTNNSNGGGVVPKGKGKGGGDSQRG